MSDAPKRIELRELGARIQEYLTKGASDPESERGAQAEERPFQRVTSVLGERRFDPGGIDLEEVNAGLREVHDPTARGQLSSRIKRAWLRTLRVLLRPYDSIQRRRYEATVRVLNTIPSYVDERCGELERRDHAIATASDAAMTALAERTDLLLGALERDARALEVGYSELRSTFERTELMLGALERRARTLEGGHRRLDAVVSVLGLPLPTSDDTWYENLAVHLLPSDQGKRWIVNERIVEVPFVLSRLPRPPARALDVGCCESVLPLQLAALGLEAWALDTRSYAPAEMSPRGLTFLQGDIRSTEFEEAFFDCVIALSTIEHVGLLHYGESVLDSEGDRRGICEIRRILKPGGCLLLTLPFGIRGATTWYRVYDRRALEGLLEGFEIQELQTFRSQENSWFPCKPEEAERVDSISGSSRVLAVACVRATPKV